MKFSLTILVLLISASIMAQADTANSKTYTVIYSGIVNKKYEPEFKNLIKINPILILAGDIPIYFESKLSKVLTVEGGVGITYFDYLENLGSLFKEEQDYSSVDIYPDYGYSIRGNLRYYPSYILDEWYFGLGVQYKKYNSRLENISTHEKINEVKKVSDARLMVGYISYLSDRVFADVYGTIGFRFKSITNHNGNNLYRTPAFSFGVKLGFAL